jgi:DNA-binding NarL/FixJ family response regulator
MVLSQYVESSYAEELLGSGYGGIGYLLKDRVSDLDDFLASLVSISRGGTVLDPLVIRQMMSLSGDPISELTRREREVLTLMAQGKSNTAISQDMVITLAAVEKHTQRIFAKLSLRPDDTHAHRRVAAVLKFLRSGG